MIKTNGGVFTKIIAVILVISILLSVFAGCGNTEPEESSSIDYGNVTVSEIVTEGVPVSEASTTSAFGEVTTSVPDMDPVTNEETDEEWKKYIGDFETFTYGLLVNQLENEYNVFPAYTQLSTGDFVSGLAYTDYNECYTNEDESACCFYAGFIPFGGELDISDEEFDAGLTIHDIEYEDDSTVFLMKYMSTAFERHCVVYGKYLKYGVDAKGQIAYSVQDYNKNEIDTSLGALYSYDESKYLYDDNFGNYVHITGTSLVTDIDYEALEREINKLLEEQDKNFVTVDVKTCAFFSQDAIESYLLSLQEETFLGYRVEDIRAAVANLDPLQCIRITSNGFEVIEQQYVDKSPMETAARWLIGTGCVIAATVSVVGAKVFFECPPLMSASSALMGTSIEMFMQVVAEHRSLQDLSWQDISLAAATGAVSGLLGPYISAICGQGLGYFIADSTIDGLLGGLEEGVKSYLNGAKGKELAVSFGKGAAFAGVLSAGFKGVSKIVGGIIEKLSPAINDHFPKIAQRISELIKPFEDKIEQLTQKANGSVFHSKYIAKKLSQQQKLRFLGKKNLKKLESDKLFDVTVDKLPTKYQMYDASGRPLAKSDLHNKKYYNMSDGMEIGFIDVDGEIVTIKKSNGAATIFFDTTKYPTAKLDEIATTNREGVNFPRAREKFIQIWKENKELLPKEIEDILKELDNSIENIKETDLKQILSKVGWTIHENDLMTVQLVPTALHEHIHHTGGVNLAGYWKEFFGAEHFQELSDVAYNAFHKIAA